MRETSQATYFDLLFQVWDVDQNHEQPTHPISSCSTALRLADLRSVLYGVLGDWEAPADLADVADAVRGEADVRVKSG